MKILLLGSTGRTGKLVLPVAIQMGHHVNCLVRSPGKVISSERVNVFKGDTTNPKDLAAAMTGCHAIISVLNISRNSDFPWSKLRTSPTLLSDTMNSLIPVAMRCGIRRIVLCSAWGVAETKKDLPAWFRWFIDHSNVGVAYRDHERQENVVMNSDLDWTIVRPAGLLNLKKEQVVTESYQNNPRPGMTINRLSVATYMVAAVENRNLIGKTPVISGA